MMKDERILRKLAREYAVAAADEKNIRNRKLHTAVNDIQMIRPVVLIDEIPFHEINVDGSLTLQCEDPLFRAAEDYFRKKLFQWKYFPADMILPPYYPVEKIVHSTGNGFEIKERTLAIDSENNIVSHEYHDQIQDQETFVKKFHLPVLTYDEKTTMEIYSRIGNVFADILPVRIVGKNSQIDPWDRIAYYRGVTPLLIDLLDEPEFSHLMAASMRDYYLSLHKQMEELNLFEAEPLDIHCTSALNSTLPGNFDGGTVRQSQVWGRGAAQVFSSVSKAMHEEFDIAYMKEIMEPFGLVYYGCCEPLDKKIDIVEKIPHLRKISITPWADINCAAEVIGNRYVIASKPNPSSVCGKLDEAQLRKELGTILSACKRYNCSFDLVLKDISSVGYNLENLVRWEQIAMEMVQQY